MHSKVNVVHSNQCAEEKSVKPFPKIAQARTEAKESKTAKQPKTTRNTRIQDTADRQR